MEVVLKKGRESGVYWKYKINYKLTAGSATSHPINKDASLLFS